MFSNFMQQPLTLALIAFVLQSTLEKVALYTIGWTHFISTTTTTTTTISSSSSGGGSGSSSS